MLARARRIVLPVVLSLALGGAATASAQTVPGVETTAPGTSTQAPNEFPQLSPETTTTTAPRTTTSPRDPAARTRTTPEPEQALPSALPDTGLDGRVLAGIGLGLLLCGLGLRLRTARERF